MRIQGFRGNCDSQASWGCAPALPNRTQVVSLKRAAGNQKVVETKEVRLSLNIDTNDFNTKVNQANKFIKNGDKVKASIRFRGREMAHTKRGMDVMTRFGEAIEGGVIEKAAKLEGRSMQMVIAPAPKK